MAKPAWLTTRNILTGVLVLYLLNVWVGVMQEVMEPSNPVVADLRRLNESLRQQLCKEDPARDGCEDYRDEAFCKDHPKLKGCRRFLWWRY